MSWAEMQKMGYARIICDTSTMTVGDTIRVKSVYNPTQYMDKQVVTVGTPVVFDLGFIKDYVKICTVQTINDTPTEIGGVYKTVDYGQTLFVNVLDKTTLGGIQGILNAHQETSLLAVGDEVNVKISGSDVAFQVAGLNLYDSHEVIFVAKDLYQLNAFEPTYNLRWYGIADIRNVVQTIYANINETDKAYIKDMTRQAYLYASQGYDTYTDKLWIPSFFEIKGEYPYNQTPLTPQHQFPLFVTQANRIKTYNGTAWGYWTNDHEYNSANCVAMGTQGVNVSYNQYNANVGVLPCFMLTADS